MREATKDTPSDTLGQAARCSAGLTSVRETCLSGRQPSTPHARPDAWCTPAALWRWGLPIGFVLVATSLWNAHQLPAILTGGILTLATAWIGVACYLNGRACGRVHCQIDGVLLPLLSLVGVVNLLGMISFNWNGYAAAFWIILGLSFVPECLGVRYLTKQDRA